MERDPAFWARGLLRRQRRYLNITVSPAAPTSGMAVTLTSADTSHATVPATVTIAAGALTKSFFVTKGLTDGPVKITASIIGSSQSFTLGTGVTLDLAAPTADGQPLQFVKCADEGGTCVLGSPGYYVAFGSGSNFVYKTTAGASLACSVTGFGSNPGGTGARACWFAPYRALANEGSSTAVTQTTDVAYGANGHFKFKRMNGSFTCDSPTFGGDPIQGVVKQCLAGLLAYTFIAAEGQPLQSDSLPVAYGANGHFFYKIIGGGATCGNSNFGDPVL